MFNNIYEKIDYLKINCGKSTICLHAIEPGVVHNGFKRMLCNSWLCPKCRKRKTRIWCNKTAAFFKGDRLSILTITFDREFTIDEAYSNASACFNRFRTSLTRKIGRFRYVKVIEAQPRSGYPHFHILINRFIPQSLLKSIAVASGFGRILDVREVPGHQAQYYVRKYLTKPWQHKQALQIFTDLNSRRCSGSHGFALYSPGKTRWRSLGPRRDYDTAARIKHINNSLGIETTPNLVTIVEHSDWSCISVSYWGLAPRQEPAAVATSLIQQPSLFDK